MKFVNLLFVFVCFTFLQGVVSAQTTQYVEKYPVWIGSFQQLPKSSFKIVVNCEKEPNVTITKNDPELLELKKMSKDRVFLGFKGQNGHGIQAFNFSDFKKKIISEQRYLEMKYDIKSIPNVCDCLIKPTDKQKLRSIYDDLEILRKMADHENIKSSADPFSVYWTALDLITRPSEHVDQRLARENVIAQVLDEYFSKKKALKIKNEIVISEERLRIISPTDAISTRSSQLKPHSAIQLN